jgi:DNA end-binding protein Ku
MVMGPPISIGIVNIPVRAIPITVDRKLSFRMLHQKCNTPISYRLFCEEGNEVPKSEIAYGHKLKGHDYLVLDKKRSILQNLRLSSSIS